MIASKHELIIILDCFVVQSNINIYGGIFQIDYQVQ